MDFIIQYNLLSETLLTTVKHAVRYMPHKFVGLIPFSREITSDEPITGLDHIPYGSTSFVETALELGWKGLSFDINKFSYDVACGKRNDMLNDRIFRPVKDMIPYLRMLGPDDVFIRPAHDLKQFSGAVYSAKEAADFLTDAMNCASSGSYKIDKDFLIVCSEPQKIMIEWRWFIIGGKVIDGSMYRRNGQLVKLHNKNVAEYEKIQKLADQWLPAPCCVMDTALLPSGEIKVVEFNCINGSGFYDHDVGKIMATWMRYHDARAA